MKYHTIKALLLILISTNVLAQYSLFDTSYLHEVKISSTDPNFWQQLDDDYNAWLSGSATDIPYLHATVEIDGTSMDDVGVRQKGYSSNFFTTSTKKPLKLNFGTFSVDGEREFSDVRKVNLMNGVGDPAIAKDKLVHDLFRMHGVPGPRVSHAKVYVNDEFWGIYALIEQIDKRYLKRNYSDNDGNLWKNKGNSNLHDLGVDPANYTFELQTNETVNDWTKFLGFIDFINNSTDIEFANDLADIFVLDEYLRILAIDIITNNWDSYLDHGRNWYMYHEPKKDKIHWLPWDYNFAFDRNIDGSDDLSIVQDSYPVGEEKILIKRIFETPEYKEKIFNYMCEIIEVNFTSNRINPMLSNQLSLVFDEWGATNDFFTTTDLDDSINGEFWSGGFFSAQGMKKFVEERSLVVKNELIAEGHSCVSLATAINSQDVVINEFMARNDDGSPWVDQDGEFDDWIELYNNTDTEISLKDYFLSDTDAFMHKWELPENSVIPANGYLMIWADKDPHQVGLHAKFSLPKKDSSIYLSYLDGTLIDSVSYGSQDKNKSMSRFPNGTGDFIEGVVTFNSENQQNDLIFAAGFE